MRPLKNRPHLLLLHRLFLCQGELGQKKFRLINSEKLYPQEMSFSLAEHTLNELKKREAVNRVTFTLSEFIEKNYKTTKLFNQCNHPKKPLLVFLTQKILSELKIDFSLDEFSATTGLDGTSIPAQKSTYANLGVLFEEDFKSYRISSTQFKSQGDIVKEYYKTYNSVDRKLIKSVVKKAKRFRLRPGRWLLKPMGMRVGGNPSRKGFVD